MADFEWRLRDVIEIGGLQVDLEQTWILGNFHKSNLLVLGGFGMSILWLTTQTCDMVRIKAP